MNNFISDRKNGNLQYGLLLFVLLLLAPLVGWGQDLGGCYYIKSNYDATFYLCPSEPCSLWYHNDAEQPFLTTNTQTGNDRSVWYLMSEMVGDVEYYYLVHLSDDNSDVNKYLTFNEVVANSGGSYQQRLRVHLQEDPDDSDDKNSLFKIVSGSGFYTISPKSDLGNSLNPAGNNYEGYCGTADKTVVIGGQTKNVGGLIGIWGNSDDRSKWILDPIVPGQPTISYTYPNVTITHATSTSFKYTTDGSDPMLSSTALTTSGSFSWTTPCTIKAVALSADGFSCSKLATYNLEQVATPALSVISNRIYITCATTGASIYYTTDGNDPDPTNSSQLYNNEPLTCSGTTIKAIAVKAGMVNSGIFSGSETLTCDLPIIRKTDSDKFTITCGFPTSGVSIYYTTDGSVPSNSSDPYNGEVTFNTGNLPFTVKAIAYADNYAPSNVAEQLLTVDLQEDSDGFYIISSSNDFITFVMMVNGDYPDANYKIINDINVPADAVEITVPFTGELKGIANANGLYPVLSGQTHAIFNTVNGGKVHDIMLKNVNIEGSGNVGAICGVANGAARIYNCGILPTTTKYKADGSVSGFTGSEVKSLNGYCGSLVGLLDGTARVINCFSYAKITGGTTVAGIVGQNNQVSTMNDIKTIVVNCVFFGEITGGSTVFPVYGGNIIENSGTTGINNYNYYRGESAFDDGYPNEAAYNRSWPAAEKNMRRFEYYRSILNSNRRLCTWWVNGTNGSAPTDEAVASVGIAKWVIDPSIAPFPVLKRWGKYPSIINIDEEKVYDTLTNQWVNRTNARPYQGKKLGTLTVTIKTGAHPATVGLSVIENESRTLVITDMDTLNYDYCYGKVQLPYYNDVFGNPNLTESVDNHVQRYYGNYTDKVVTGWKITAVTTRAGYVDTVCFEGPWDDDGTRVRYRKKTNAWESGFNYADRKCTSKDLYVTTRRVFAQGGYYYVPEGVTAIEIEAYWGKAFYLQAKDNYLDRVDVARTKNYGSPFTPAGTLPTTVNYNDGSSNQSVSIYNDFATIKTAFMANQSCTVYDQAVVLLSNYPLHAENDFASGNGNTAFSNDGKGGVTLMSADLDMDNEPDFCFPFQWRAAATYTRFPIMPFRFDFLPIPELGMAMRHNKYAYSIGIFVPQGHFEITETAFIYTTQYEYMSAYKARNHQQPLILNGGQFEQIVCHADSPVQEYYTSNIIMGGHIWMKRFTPGSHAGKLCYVRHCAVSVMGGEFPEFYLTGLYRADVDTDHAYPDSPHCYTNGGRFGIMAGAATESVKKDVVFQIDHSIIREFYGGGCNSANPVEGNIDVTINHSLVLDKYCGGPKVGEMGAGKNVTTNATGTHFCHDFFGGGNGGTNLYRQQLKDETPNHMPNESEWRGTYGFDAFNPVHGATPTFNEEWGYYAEFEFEVFNQSNGLSDHAVARTYQHWAQFGTTRTGNIENNLTGCVIDGNFYGGGSLGNVGGGDLGDKTIVSTLTSDTIYGNVFGAGYSAEIPSFQAHTKNLVSFPKRDAAGVVVPASISYDPKKYTWCYKVSDTETIPPGITIPEGVNTTNPTFEFPENSGHWYCLTTKTLVDLGQVSGNVTLTLTGATVVGTEGDDTTGNVYGGGEASAVSGNTTVILRGGTNVRGNVYGGGDEGEVSGASSVSIQD